MSKDYNLFGINNIYFINCFMNWVKLCFFKAFKNPCDVFKYIMYIKFCFFHIYVVNFTPN